MNLSLFIARRYFLSRKKKTFINVISIISMIVVAIGTMCLIVALSVFNGLEGLLRSVYGNFDPDIIVSAKVGKSFVNDAQWIEAISDTKGVKGLIPVIEDNVLAEFKDSQRLVRIKGVDAEAFKELSGIKEAMVAGDFNLTKDSIGYALVGRGVQYDLSLNLKNEFSALRLYYPKNIAPGVLNPEKMYQVLNILPGGIFAIERFYDEKYVFVPIEFARRLLSYSNKISAYEVYLEEGSNPKRTKEALIERLSGDFNVQLGEELHSDLFKVLSIEKLFVFLILTSIIGIASINIFFSLTMLVIEKRKDVAILFAQGADQKLIRNVFLLEGCIVAFTGAGIGLFLGLGISLLQQQFGIVGMGMQSAIMNSYPVKIELTDVGFTVIAIVVITILASIQPALKASKSFNITSLQ